MKILGLIRLPSKPAAKPRRSYAARWILVRKTVQWLALALFLVLLLAARWTNSPLQPWSGTFFKINPLVSLTTWLHSLSVGVLLPSGSLLWLGGIVLALSLLVGRGWCGWLCPLGTVLDWLTPSRDRGWDSRAAQPADRLRSLKYILLLVTLFSALLGSLTWMVFDPITLLERTLTHSIWPALNWLVTRSEFLLYRFLPGSGDGLVAFDQLVRPVILPDVPVPRTAPFTIVLVFSAVVGLNWLAPRFWCRYLCPFGGLLGWVSKWSLIRRVVRKQVEPLASGSHNTCTACQLCSRGCPTGTIDPENDFASDPAECTLCLECLDACPRRATTFSPQLPIGGRFDYDPGRREALVSFAAAVGSLALFGSGWLRLRQHPFRLRPPGVSEELETDGGDMPGCIRCGACLQTCPTSALQPAFEQAGLEGLWTPVMVPRLGYCDYSCNACGQVCPVAAIPSLTLEEKRQQVVGKAYIDQDRCLAWSDRTECIVCEEMCPLPEKAITWDVGESAAGQEPLQRPVVDREKCIGCGICEYKCPLPGPAAIRVYSV